MTKQQEYDNIIKSFGIFCIGILLGAGLITYLTPENPQQEQTYDYYDSYKECKDQRWNCREKQRELINSIDEYQEEWYTCENNRYNDQQQVTQLKTEVAKLKQEANNK